ncbi:MAG: hypothetical protein QOG13_584 [Sphingomonadales bacterium]|jgi:hypothetical protein|nr:hypothetical protein [Sphingomonadales bacterium]
MDDSDLLAFTPVPLRARADGWTPRKQYFFILGLARGFTPEKAAAILGMTRKTAYELRKMPGGEGFAAAWAAAVARARERRLAARGPSLAERARHGEWVPRLYRGRIVGWTHRPANARLMGLLKRLDRQAERLPPGADPAYLEAYLATLPPERDSPDANALTRRQSCNVPRPPQGLGKSAL